MKIRLPFLRPFLRRHHDHGLSKEDIRQMLHEARENSERTWPRFDERMVHEIAMRRLDAQNAWALNDPAVLKRQMIEAFRFARQEAAPGPVGRGRTVVVPRDGRIPAEGKRH